MISKLDPVELERLSKVATQGVYVHTGRISWEDAQFFSALADLYRTGQLVPAMPSGDVVEAVKVAERQFANDVWDALKGDHNDLRKQQAIIRAHRSVITTYDAARAALGEK